MRRPGVLPATRRVFLYQLCSDEEADSYRFMQILTEAAKAGASRGARLCRPFASGAGWNRERFEFPAAGAAPGPPQAK